MDENDKQRPEQGQSEEPQISFFELIAPRKAPREPDAPQDEAKPEKPQKQGPVIMSMPPLKPPSSSEEEDAEEEHLTIPQRMLRTLKRYTRLAIFCAVALLAMFVMNKVFGIGNGSPRTLAPDNVARMIVFPHCTYELLESDVTSYPGVIGAVAAYDEADGALMGYAYDMYCRGESGEVLLTAGIRADGTITGVSITAHKETRGLGTSAGNLFVSNFAGVAADEQALDEIPLMDSTPDTSRAIIEVVKQAVRHAHDNYGIVGHADEELHQAVAEDIRANNTYDSPELQALLPGATFYGYYPDKGYPLKGFASITMAYLADWNGQELYAFDVTTRGSDGEMKLSVAIAQDDTIAAVRVHSQHEQAFEGNDILADLEQALVGCDRATLNSVPVVESARYPSNAVINAAQDAIYCKRAYFK